MLFFTAILGWVALTGVTLWRTTGDRFALYLGLAAPPLWVWAYILFGGF